MQPVGGTSHRSPDDATSTATSLPATGLPFRGVALRPALYRLRRPSPQAVSSLRVTIANACALRAPMPTRHRKRSAGPSTNGITTTSACSTTDLPPPASKSKTANNSPEPHRAFRSADSSASRHRREKAHVRRCDPACHAYSRGQSDGSPLALRPRWREVTALRARAACPGTDALPRRQLSLNRRSPWASKPSSPSGVESCRRASFRKRSSGRSRHNAYSRDARDQPRSRPTGSTRRAANRAGSGERNPANDAGRRWWPRAAAGAARTASGLKATSSARDAATTGTSSAHTSARTPSTPQLLMSSRQCPRPRTVRVTSTSESRPGTDAGSRSPVRPTGRRCRTRSRERNASGRTRCGIRVGGISATSCRHGGASAPVRAPPPSRRSRKPCPTRSGPSRATGTVCAADPLRAASAPARYQAGWRPRLPSRSTMPDSSAMSPRSTTAGAIPARAATTPDPRHRDAQRGRRHLAVSRDPSFKRNFQRVLAVLTSLSR